MVSLYLKCESASSLVGTFNQEMMAPVEGGGFSVIVCEIFANLGIAFVSSSTATAVHRAPLSPLIGYMLNALCAVINDPDDRRLDKSKIYFTFSNSSPITYFVFFACRCRGFTEPKSMKSEFKTLKPLKNYLILRLLTLL